MSAFTDFTEAAIRDVYKTGGSLTASATYVGLSTTDPGETGSTAGEPTGAWYSRQQVYTTGNASTPEWQNSSTGTGIENAQTVSFPQATTTPGSVSHMFIADSTTGGANNVLFKTALNTAKTIASNDTAEFNTGDVQFTFD